MSGGGNAWGQLLTVLALAALLVAAGLALDRLPTPEEGGRHWSLFHRGHKPPGVERAGENLNVPVAPGQYPPRALGLSGRSQPPTGSTANGS